MTQAEQRSRYPLERLSLLEWQVQTLRLTAFPHSVSRSSPRPWWERVFRGPPDSEVTEPTRGKYTARGPFEGGELILCTQPGRIDWLLGSLESDFAEIPTAGDLPELLEVFCELVARWLKVEEPPALTRVAFGAILLHPAPDHEAGYRQLQPYLRHVELDPIGSSDFLYRINRPRDSTSGMPGLRVNRLSVWSVVAFQSALLRAGFDDITPVSEPVTHYACRLELDINTAPRPQELFERDQLPLIFRELVDLGREITQEGDIP